MRNSNEIANLLKSKLKKRRQNNKLINKYRKELYVKLGKFIMKNNKINGNDCYTVADFKKNFEVTKK